MYNVWLVDDEPLILEGLAALVDWSSLGLILVGTAENGVDALEQMERQNAHIDILITDISMPEMDGLELIRVLKKRNPELKCIILSGYNEFDYVREGMRAGIENYLLKPINFDELGQTLLETVEKFNRPRIAALHEDQIDLLKDNILHRWVTGRIGKEQWSQRSSFLNLRLSVPVVVAAIVRMGEERSLEQIQECLRQTRDYLDGRGRSSICFLNMEDDLVILLGADAKSEESLSDIQRLLAEISQHLAALTGAPPLIALGTMEDDFELAPVSYRNAMKAMEQAILYSRDRLTVVVYTTNDQPVQEERFVDPDAYTRLLLAHEDEALLNRIEEDFRAVSATPGLTPAIVKHQIFEMIVHMKSILHDFNIEDSFYAKYHDILNQLDAAANIQQLKELVASISLEISGILSGRQKQNPVVRQILEYIEISYMKDFSLKTLAHTHGMHPVYLGQLFQKETGQSFSDYLNRFRVGRSVELMRTTPMKIVDISKAVGFWDTAHFYKNFKKYMGVSPAQYRSHM